MTFSLNLVQKFKKEDKDLRKLNHKMFGNRIFWIFLPLFFTSCIHNENQETILVDVSTAVENALFEVEKNEGPREENRTSAELDFYKMIKGAVESNKSYTAALAAERAMSSRVTSVKSVRKAQIRGNSTVGGIRETGGRASDKTHEGAAVSLNLSQIIYDGGLSSSNIDRAEAQAFGASAERKSLGNDIALQAAKAWIDNWQYQTRLSILHKRTLELDDLISKMERMANNGMSDRSALDSVRRQVLDIALEKKLLQNDQNEAAIKFKHFFNQKIARVSKPDKLVGLSEVRAQAENWQAAPDLQRIAAEVVVAKRGVEASEAAFKPQARLQAGLTSPMQEGESTDASFGVVVEYTFGDGGRRLAELEEAEASFEAAKARLDDASKMLSSEMNVAIKNLNSLQESLPLMNEKISLSRLEVETARSQLATGQSNLRQLIAAELENYRAEDKLIVLEANNLIVQLSILAKTGALADLVQLKNL